MRGHFIGGTRRLNKHYQSGDGGEGEIVNIWATALASGTQINAAKRTGLIGILATPKTIYPWASKSVSWVVSFTCEYNQYPLGTVSQSDVEGVRDYLPTMQRAYAYYIGGSVGLNLQNQPIKIEKGDKFYIVIKTKRFTSEKEFAFLYEVEIDENSPYIMNNYITFTSNMTTPIVLWECKHGNASAVKALYDKLKDASTWDAVKYTYDDGNLVEDENGTAAPTMADIQNGVGDKMQFLFSTKKSGVVAIVDLTWREMASPEFKALNPIMCEPIKI